MSKWVLLTFFLLVSPSISSGFDQLESDLTGFLVTNCVDCHARGDANGDVVLEVSGDDGHVLNDAVLLDRVLNEIANGTMPPSDVSEVSTAQRKAVVVSIKSRLVELVKDIPEETVPISRLNRFQYNNTVRDLFEIDRDVFALTEKLMVRETDYLDVLGSDLASWQLPSEVKAQSSAVAQRAGMKAVKPFPKDLRAEHGYDNQASQLTLSPLLLDSFFKLSVSIVESEDFNKESVGIWDSFFESPQEGINVRQAVKERLSEFIPIAFRQKVDEEVVSRYTEYAIKCIDESASFSDGMKKVSAAVLSSPLFLYRTNVEPNQSTCYSLASKLSYCLWGSCPDAELLSLAATGELSDQAVLTRTINRMMADPKIKRFLDAFPVQWLQLENVLAATPSPRINRFYSINTDYPAGLQMLIEPLLLFDLVFIEDRLIHELITPKVVYRSDFLDEWYNTDLKPEAVDVDAIKEANDERRTTREALRLAIEDQHGAIEGLIDPARELIFGKKAGSEQAVDLRPYAVWRFEGDLTDEIGDLDLISHGEIRFESGGVVLDKAFLQSPNLSDAFTEKSLEVRFSLSDLDQRGGGLMTMQAGNLFDSIVIGERQNRHWISGSNGFVRTEDFPGSVPEHLIDDSIHLLMTYQSDGSKTLYRNGVRYGDPFQKGSVTFKALESFILFGLRHLPPGGNRYLNVRIDEAKLYDRPLTESEAAEAYQSSGSFISDQDLREILTASDYAAYIQMRSQLRETRKKLSEVPPDVQFEEVRLANEKAYENRIRNLMRSPKFKRVDVSDPRYGGILTNAAILTMTSGPDRTHPVARGVWITEVLFNDPPSPPPNDIPPLDEDASEADLTIREKFAEHRANPSCAGCHNQLDPLGFALENYDITGRWRVKYENGRDVDPSGSLSQNSFTSVSEFKKGLLSDVDRFAEAFAQHFMRYALARELTPKDRVAVREIAAGLRDKGYPVRSLIHSVLQTESFLARSIED